jgi:SAM-dependent methyltransferase
MDIAEFAKISDHEQDYPVNSIGADALSTSFPATALEGESERMRTIDLVCAFNELPFESSSLDLVVLPHALEFAPDPHATLREVERVLVPEGRVVVSGFNNWSLWGARQAVSRKSGKPFLPRAGEFIGYRRMKDWLRLLSLEFETGHFGCYRPPVRSQAWLSRTAIMDKAGDRWWPVFGAAYCMVAVKRVRGMHFIAPVKRKGFVPSGGLRPAINTGSVSANDKTTKERA